MKMIGMRGTDARVKRRERLFDSLRERGDPLRHEMPGSGDVHVDVGMCGTPRGNSPLVAREDDWRILRRQSDHDDSRDAVLCERVERPGQ